MEKPRADVFFYGSYMNFAVLGEVGIGERAFDVVSVQGFELTISPLANLKRVPHGLVFGTLTQLTHAELDRLYLEHAPAKLGGVYLPEAVVARRESGEMLPALCYIAHELEETKADPAYVDRILKSALACGFPSSYTDHIRCFK
jgi:hypothetical protein